MSRDLDSNDASLPLPALERIDRACLDFEAAWKAGRTPRVEEYLGQPGVEFARLLATEKRDVAG